MISLPRGIFLAWKVVEFIVFLKDDIGMRCSVCHENSDSANIRNMEFILHRVVISQSQARPELGFLTLFRLGYLAITQHITHA